MNFRLNDIKNFVHTSDCNTIIQAAKKLEMSQPALSESLKRLESDAGYILFYRSRNGIKLTPSGKIFLQKAHLLLESYQSLSLKNEEKNIFAGRKITIGCHATVAQYFIANTLIALKEMAPDYNIDLRHDLSRNIQTQIQHGEIDIGIVINPSIVPDLIIQKITQDNVYIWKSESTPKNMIFDTIVCNLDLYQTQSILKKWKQKPQKIISSTSLELLSQLTHNQIGYGIIPERAVALTTYRLKPLTKLPHYQDDIALVYRPEFGKTLPEKYLIQALKQAINKL